MHEATVLVPGARQVEATLDSPDTETDICVVAAPPHPQAGGHRGDRRLAAVSDHLVDHGVACLRFDYGAWDEGYGEREDTRNALRWATAEFDRVGLFGYSFGASMALLAAASAPDPATGATDPSDTPTNTAATDLDAVCVLAPQSHFAPDLDAAAAVVDVRAPLRVVVGVRDDTVDWEPVVEAAREHGHDVVELQSDHHFVGQDVKVGSACGEFLESHLTG